MPLPKGGPEDDVMASVMEEALDVKRREVRRLLAMGERATYCPRCRLREATDTDAIVVPQGEDGGLCWARWGSPCPIRERLTVHTMRNTSTMDAGYHEASGCAEQPERGRITGAGQFHYEGNSTTIPAFLLSWCTAPIPGDDFL